MVTYVMRDGVLVEKDKAPPLRKETRCMPCDLPEYISPITGKPVDGRTERREELKRHGCREVDPSEWKDGYTNERFIKKHGIRQ